MALGTTIGTRPPSGDPQKRKWTRETYHRAADLGLFGPEERVELIKGEIYEKVSPQNWPHSSTTRRIAKKLDRLLGDEFEVFTQSPMAASNDSEPEPDVMVVQGDIDALRDHPGPADAVLVVEVSDTTARFDRTKKAALYAEVGVTDYWILSVKERCLYVLRDPFSEDEVSGYRSTERLGEDGTVSPLAAPGCLIAVLDLLPKIR